MSAAPNLLLLSLISCYIVVVFFTDQVDATSYSNNTGVWFELIHRHSPKLKTQSKFLGAPKSRSDRIRQLLQSDNARQKMVSSHREQAQKRSTRKAYEIDQAAEIPLRSGADTGEGEYFVSFRIGSPHPQKFVLVADTGSDLTWMNCKYWCKDCPKPNPHPGRVFRANDSPSFRTIPCSSDTCQIDLVSYHALPDCPSPNTPCLFEYGYVGGLKAVGVFANETVTVGLRHGHIKIRLFDVLIGCTESFNTSTNFPDGVMGLGYSQHSFALRLAKIFGNKFSYCLVDHLSPSNLNNYLTFGEVERMELPKVLQYTELLLGTMGPFYYVNISGISIGGKMLNIPSEIWNVSSGDGGAIVDSGTSLTFLAGPAYDAVVDALKPSLAKFKNSEEVDVIEHCFEDRGFEESLVPNFVFHFADGAKYEPPVKNYVINVANGIKCLGFVRGAWPGPSVIGNILQQNHHWEFDIGKAKLGFGPSSCIISD